MGYWQEQYKRETGNDPLETYYGSDRNERRPSDDYVEWLESKLTQESDLLAETMTAIEEVGHTDERLIRVYDKYVNSRG